MKPNQIKHLTDSELHLINLTSETFTQEFHRENDRRGRCPNLSTQKYFLDRLYVNERWKN